MCNITGNIRRATQDMDFDFIRYSLDEESIRRFVETLNCLSGIKIAITGNIEELSQHEYRGKRVYIEIRDERGYTLHSKIDLGVHTNFCIEQEEYCFDVCMDDSGASLLINSREQMFTEKLRSLLKFGPLSTRYKDIYDMSYLCAKIDRNKLNECLRLYVYDDKTMREENIEDVRRRVYETFSNKLYCRNAHKNNKANWSGIGADDAFKAIEDFLNSIPV